MIGAALVAASLVFGGISRTYDVHVPSSVQPPARVPLLIALHGGGGTADGMARISGLSATADAHTFIVVYPQGVDKRWSDGRGSLLDQRGIDDVGFLTAMLVQLERDYPIDAERVYVTGLSNGGFMAQWFGCERADRLAAISSVAASFPAALAPTCRPARPLPVLLFHGTDDPLVPYAGGMIRSSAGTQVFPAVDSARQWAAIDGCSSAADSSTIRAAGGDDDLAVRRTVYSRCRSSAGVVLYTIDGGGHTWPDGEQYLPAFLVGKTTRNLDANEIMWQFFLAHS